MTRRAWPQASVLRVRLFGPLGKSRVGEGSLDRSFKSRGKINLGAGGPNGFFLMLGSGGLTNNCRGRQLGSYKPQRFVAGFDPGASNNGPAMAGAIESRNADAAAAECLNSLLRSKVRRFLMGTGTAKSFTIFRSPVRQFFDCLFRTLIAMQHAFAHRLAIIMARNLGELGKRFWP